MPTALLFGATGLVGGHLLELLARAPDYASVRVLVRRPLERLTGSGAGRVEPVVRDLARLEAEPELFRADDAFCCLGTTLRVAGSKPAFEAVDRELVVRLARLARAGGVERFFLVSSIGASAAARGFYLRVKGRAEDEVAALGFAALHVFRPSILVGARRESRPAERVAIAAARALRGAFVGPLRRYRAIEAQTVAAALLGAARGLERGRCVHEHDELVRLARVAGTGAG